MKLKKYSQMFEKDAKDIFPEDYLDNIKSARASQYQGGPTPQDIQEMMSLRGRISEIQNGKEDELTEIGKEIIMDEYGGILQDIELDIKIVEPFDEEKLDMTNKMGEDDEDDNQTNGEEGVDTSRNFDVDEDDVSKRKISNIVMQGEAQNVQTMMFNKKEEIDKISPELLDLYNKGLEINKKMDWDENRPPMEDFIKDHPEFANAMEINFGEDSGEDGGEEDEDDKITIKVRALDLPMLIHETIKGIYELIAAKSIPDNSDIARAIMSKTDTLKDEEEDIKYGPYIAADIRNYINNYLDEFHKDALEIENIREFIFSEMVELESNIFVDLIKSIIIDDKDIVKKIFNEFNIIESAINKSTFDDTEIEDFEESPEMEIPSEPEQKRKKSYDDMTKSELDKIVNQALEDEDFETLRKVKPYLGD